MATAVPPPLWQADALRQAAGAATASAAAGVSPGQPMMASPSTTPAAVSMGLHGASQGGPSLFSIPLGAAGAAAGGAQAAAPAHNPGTALSSGSNANNGTAGADQASDAYRHVKLVVSDARRDFDLLDLLTNTRREETYQPYPRGVRVHGRLAWDCAWDGWMGCAGSQCAAAWAHDSCKLRGTCGEQRNVWMTL